LQTVNHGESPEACPRTSNLSSRFMIILKSRSQRYWAFLQNLLGKSPRAHWYM